MNDKASNAGLNEKSIIKSIMDKLEKSSNSYNIHGNEGAVAEAVSRMIHLHNEFSISSSLFRLKTMELCQKKVYSVPEMLYYFLIHNVYTTWTELETNYPVISQMLLKTTKESPLAL